jgi:uncharacterized protein
MLVRIAGATLLCAVSARAGTDLRLVQAVKRRDRNAVNALLATKLDVNAAQPDGATALAWAAYLDEADVAEKLLAAGAKPNTADEYGETPLTLACANGDAKLVGELLQAGANARAARWDGETALMIAAGAGSVDSVNLLAAHGADVNAAESRHGQTALMWAAAERHSDVVKTLIAHGANVQAVSKQGFTPLMFAAVKNDSTSAQALMAAGADPNYTIPNGPSVLFVAAANRSTGVATLVADRGANPNTADRKGETPLHVAARAGEVTLVAELLAKGANVNARTVTESDSTSKDGSDEESHFVEGWVTPLMLAARSDHVEVMRALVAAGADVKLKADDGTTVLTAAVASGHLDAVQFAYSQYPDVTIVSAATGATLMHAAVQGTLNRANETQICEVIRFLAAHGVPLDQPDAKGKTPLYYASLPPIEKAVTLLLDLIAQSGAKPRFDPPR